MFISSVISKIRIQKILFVAMSVCITQAAFGHTSPTLLDAIDNQEEEHDELATTLKHAKKQKGRGDDVELAKLRDALISSNKDRHRQSVRIQELEKIVAKQDRARLKELEKQVGKQESLELKILKNALPFLVGATGFLWINFYESIVRDQIKTVIFPRMRKVLDNVPLERMLGILLEFSYKNTFIGARAPLPFVQSGSGTNFVAHALVSGVVALASGYVTKRIQGMIIG